jgi:hypothetical protein
MKRKDIDWSGVDWTQTNSKIGKSLGVDHTTVARARKKLNMPEVKRISTANRAPSVLARAEHMFGTMTDKAIADATGVCHQRVTAYRARLNVAAHQRSSVRGKEALLGVLPDTEIARMVGCASETVRHHRKKAGIVRCTKPAPRLYAVREWARTLGRPFTTAEMVASVGFNKKTSALGRRFMFSKWVRTGEFVVVGRDPARPGTRANLYALAEAKR